MPVERDAVGFRISHKKQPCEEKPGKTKRLKSAPQFAADAVEFNDRRWIFIERRRTKS